MNQANRVAIALGSNLGDRLATIHAAIARLKEDALEEAVVSSIYESPPWGPIADQPAFLNAVIVGVTDWKAPALLNFLKSLETELGRKTGPKYGPRVLDLDLLAVGDVVWKGEGIEVPHPRLTERDFVLLPLAEVWSRWIHPTEGVDVPTLVRRYRETRPSAAKVFAPPPRDTESR